MRRRDRLDLGGGGARLGGGGARLGGLGGVLAVSLAAALGGAELDVVGDASVAEAWLSIGGV